jgi:hypothetical protein
VCGHDFFNFFGQARQAGAEKFAAGFGNQNVVLDAHAEVFFRNVDAGFVSDDHTGL